MIRKKVLKTISINILVLYNFLIFILFAPSLAYFGYRFLVINNISDNQSKIKQRYKNREDLIKPLIEFDKLSYSYYDYIVWRRDQYNGEFININDEGVRKSYQPNKPSKDTYIFLGGSTIFGYGVADNKTIPSIFAKISQKNVLNLGDTGYTSRQSLALYSNYFINKKLDLNNTYKIISYDGANDISQKCRKEVKGIETDQQIKIRKKLNTKYGSINYFLKPWKILINAFKSNNSDSIELYDCHKNIVKAEYVADTLISTWRKIYEIANVNNQEFLAILQPLIYFEGDEVNPDYNDIFGKQFQAVYPIIKRKIKNEKFQFLDLTNELKGNRIKTYFDFCHLDAKGNEYIANAIKRYLMED